jgi:hypothetical protein
VQVCFSPRLTRIDDVIYDILVNYAGVDTSFIPFVDWQAEVARWAPNLKLTADICSPEGAASIIGELAVLGISLWWNDVAQEIRLLVNRPPDSDTVIELSDRDNIMSIVQEDRDEDRITRLSFNTVQIDPTKGVSSSNFLRQAAFIDVNSEYVHSFNDMRIKTVVSRWLNHGDDASVRILSKRLINRFNATPVLYTIELDAKDDLELAQVIEVSSRVVADEAGQSKPQLMQVIRRDDVRNGHSLKVTAQRFQFDQRYGYVTDNARPVYSSSSDAQKARGAYFVDDLTLTFGDGSSPYVVS